MFLSISGIINRTRPGSTGVGQGQWGRLGVMEGWGWGVWTTTKLEEGSGVRTNWHGVILSKGWGLGSPVFLHQLGNLRWKGWGMWGLGHVLLLGTNGKVPNSQALSGNNQLKYKVQASSWCPSSHNKSKGVKQESRMGKNNGTQIGWVGLLYVGSTTGVGMGVHNVR